MRLTFMLSLGTIAGGFLCKRIGYRLPTILGLILSSAGFFFMSRWTIYLADPSMTFHLAISGFGFGLVIAPLATTVMDSVGGEERGIASSLIVTLRMIGMIIGLAAITSWGTGRFHLMTAGMTLSEIISVPEELVESLLALFHDFFLAAAVICLATIIPAFWLGRRRRLETVR